MARHGEILDSFKQKVDNFDFSNEEHVKCVCVSCYYDLNRFVVLVGLTQFYVFPAEDGFDQVL